MAKSFTDYVQTVIVKKGLTGLFQCPVQTVRPLFNNQALFPNNLALSINNPPFSNSQKPSLESKQQKVTTLLVTNLLVTTLFHIFALKS